MKKGITIRDAVIEVLKKKVNLFLLKKFIQTLLREIFIDSMLKDLKILLRLRLEGIVKGLIFQQQSRINIFKF